MTNKSLKYLMIEDNPADVRFVREMLSEADGVPFESEHVDRLSKGLKCLHETDFDVLLLDLALPDSQGLDTFNKVHAQSHQVPVIILTGSDDASLAYKAVREGAQDYLVKNQMNSTLLIRSMYYAIERKQAEKSINQLNSKLKTIRNVDKLIVTEKNRDSLLQKTCDVLIETQDYDVALFNLYQDNQDLTYIAGSGLMEDVSYFYDHIIKAGPPSCIKRALDQSEPFIVVDKLVECEHCSLNNRHPDMETVIIRVQHDNKFFGLLHVTFSFDIAVECEKVELLMEVASDIALALHDIEILEARKQADEAFQKAYEELEQQVLEQTEELKVVNDGLGSSVAELEHFVYVTSHDLDGPLRMVLNDIHLLKQHCKNKVDTDDIELIDNAIDSTNHMQTMINDLLNISRVNNNDTSLVPTDCKEVINIALHDLKEDIKKSGAVITHDALPVVTADASQLARLIKNRISNTINFSSADHAHVHISAVQKEKEWVFSMRDNNIGCGEYPGSGIGTALGKKIIKRHGGRMWIEPVPKKGTIFHFTIPMQEKK